MQQTMETDNSAGSEPGFPAAAPGGTTYDMGYSDLFMELLGRRNAARNAAHLLDLGCGPGHITLGLARAVYPGKATGLDRDGEQAGTARANARWEGVENASFVPGESLDLPFPDNSQDVVHCPAFLMHSPRIREQLAEIVRVLKPGGILSSRDMDVPTSFISPAREDNQGMWDMLGEVVRQEGGDPWMGRHLTTFLRNAGLEDVETGFGADSFTRPEEVEFLSRSLLEWGLSPEFMARTGSSPGDFARWREQVERWSRHPGAVGCFHFGHAVGRKPWLGHPAPDPSTRMKPG